MYLRYLPGSYLLGTYGIRDKVLYTRSYIYDAYMYV